jgi:hypothetical protein
MAKLKISGAVILWVVTPSIFGSPARAKEAYAYGRASKVCNTSFFLIVGQYTLYVHAKRPIKAYSTPSSRSCVFGGNFERVPTRDSMRLGVGITILRSCQTGSAL